MLLSPQAPLVAHTPPAHSSLVVQSEQSGAVPELTAELDCAELATKDVDPWELEPAGLDPRELEPPAAGVEPAELACDVDTDPPPPLEPPGRQRHSVYPDPSATQL
jgi:hypothetical protein